MKSSKIKKYEAYIDRQIEYFTDYLKILDLEKIDIENNKMDDLKLHIEIETELLERIKQLAKIINSSIFDFKIKEINKNSETIEKYQRLERLRLIAIENNYENQCLLKYKQEALSKPIKIRAITSTNLNFLEEEPQFFNMSC